MAPAPIGYESPNLCRSATLVSESKREQNKVRNRAAILDAARTIFVEIGYETATVRDIIGRTDLAPGTFYNYFPDKRSILVAIASDISDACRQRTREARARANSVEELVRNGFHAYFDFIASDRLLFELLRRNVAALRSIGLDETGFSAGLEDLRLDVETAVAAGLAPAVPLHYLVPAIGAIAFEVGAEMAKSDPPDVAGATEFCADLCLHGVYGLVQPTTARAENP